MKVWEGRRPHELEDATTLVGLLVYARERESQLEHL